MACTPSRMHGRTMVVASCLRDDIVMGCFPFHYGGWLESPNSIVMSSAYVFDPITSSTSPSYCYSSSAVCDHLGVTSSVWFGVVPSTLWASSACSG